MEKVKKTYKQNVKVDKDWISENIDVRSWNRQIYRSRVNKFINDMKNNCFDRDTLIKLSKEKGSDKLILLDGQHRLLAIKEFGEPMYVDLVIFEEMEEELMINKYDIANEVKVHRIIDDINKFIGRHDWLDALLDERSFPVNITKGKTANSIRIDKMLNVIKNGFITTLSRQNISRKKLPSFLEEFDAGKFSDVKDFFTVYKKCFGDPQIGNWLYARNTIMFTLMRIWLKNKELFDEETIINCFKEIENKVSVKQDSVCVDALTIDSMTRKIYRVINKGRSVNKFEPFWEED